MLKEFLTRKCTVAKARALVFVRCYMGIGHREPVGSFSNGSTSKIADDVWQMDLMGVMTYFTVINSRLDKLQNDCLSVNS